MTTRLPDQIKWTPVNMQTGCRAVDSKDKERKDLEHTNLEIQINPITTVDLITKQGKSIPFKARALLDSASGINWCHKDLLQFVKYDDLGATTMRVQIFEGSVKKKYKYVQIFYTIDGREGSLKCFVTDQYAWFNEVKGLTECKTTFSSREIASAAINSKISRQNRKSRSDLQQFY